MPLSTGTHHTPSEITSPPWALLSPAPIVLSLSPSDKLDLLLNTGLGLLLHGAHGEPQARTAKAGYQNKMKEEGKMWAAEARFNVSINDSGKIPKLFLVFVIISAIF